MPQKGLLWVNSKITKPESITPTNFDKWYNDVHIPDIFKSGGIFSAYRYKNIDPAADRPYFALYPVPDIKFLGSEGFDKIPVTSDYFPGSGNCFDFADYDSRFYEFVHSYEKEGVPAGMLLPTLFCSSASNERKVPQNL